MPYRSLARAAVRAVALPSLLASPLAAQAPRSAVPPAPRLDSTETFHGTRVADPYRWLERYAEPDVRRWYEAEARAAERALAAGPARAAILRAYAAARRSRPYAVSLPIAAGGRQFYARRRPGDETAALWVRDADGRERRLFTVDQVRPAATTPAAFAGVVPSPDGRLAVVQYVLNGDERVLARVVDVATGRLLDGPFAASTIQFGPSAASAIQWTRDGRAFWYVPRRDLGPAATTTQLVGGLPLRRHRVGTPVADDVVAFDPRAHGGDSTTIVRLVPQGGGALALSLEQEANTQAADLWLAVEGAATDGGWRRVATLADSVQWPMVRGDWLYAVASRGVPNGRLVRTPLARPDWRAAEVVVPESGALLWEWGPGLYAAAADAFYHVRTDSGRSRLLRTPFDGGATTEIAAPFDGSFGPLAADPARPGVAFPFGGWTVGDRNYRYDPAVGRMAPLPARFNPPNPYATLPGLTVETTFAPAADGVRVPMTILRGPPPAGRPSGGPRPTILEGYGAYGRTDDAFFRPQLRPWLASGGAYVFCHVRGGGYYGRAWREGGLQATKPNTWRDGIACAEALVRAGVTTPAQLGITGASAGGIFAGRAITERPELFGAAAILVGVSDMVRFELGGAGPSNVDEFGSVRTEPGFRALLAMSPYHHVQGPEAGVRYPATLLYAGFNDRRVLPWHPAKLAAALRHAGGAAAAPDGARPVLLTVDFGAGHGAGATASTADARAAASLAFLAERLGLQIR